jgi:transcriptional regulator with XRE-family HTH domain
MFTQNLRWLRALHGLTQRQICALLNIAQPTYAQIERGTMEPSIRIIRDLTMIFACTADELLFGDSEYEVEVDDITSRLDAKTYSLEEAHKAYLAAKRKSASASLKFLGGKTNGHF